MTYTYRDVAKMIDHSLLNPTLTADELESGCRLARLYDVASVGWRRRDVRTRMMDPVFARTCSRLCADPRPRRSR